VINLSAPDQLGRELIKAYISVADGELNVADGEVIRLYLRPMLRLINWVANYCLLLRLRLRLRQVKKCPCISLKGA
jgi:hypothetical protein